MRARYYDPGIGRFITKDPFPGVLSLPSTLHPYQYALNNPINWVDPSGEFIFAAIVGGILIGGGLAALGFVSANPGYTLSDYLNSGCFWRAVGIGAATGIVAGLVGGFIGGLGVFGLGLKGAILSGMAGGFFAGLASESLRQYLAEGGVIDPLGVLVSGGAGLVTGGIFAAIGYSIGSAARRILSNQWNAIKTQGYKHNPAWRAGVGGTDRFGNISISPHGSSIDRARALLHERIHSLLTPRGYAQRVRSDVAIWLYENSHLFRYMEEGLAEAIAQAGTGGSIRTGLSYPFNAQYLPVKPINLAIETILTAGGISGALHLLYQGLKK